MWVAERRQLKDRSVNDWLSDKKTISCIQEACFE